MAFEVEEIDDANFLYRRVHRNVVTQQMGQITSGCFKFANGELSCDWDKYATPEDARAGGKGEPHKNYVVKFNVGELRTETLVVAHTPIWPDNQAHSDVLACDREHELAGRLALFNSAKKHGWVLEPASEPPGQPGAPPVPPV